MARAATPAIAALGGRGWPPKSPHDVLECHHDPRSTAFGAEVVGQLAGTDGIVAQLVFKTLVLAVPTGPGRPGRCPAQHICA